jgi:nucleosome binding factor SPN SPT16 subunit
MVVKDANEIKCMERSANVTTYFFHKLVDNILHTIDNEQMVTHAEIAAKIESLLENEN